MNQLVMVLTIVGLLTGIGHTAHAGWWDDWFGDDEEMCVQIYYDASEDPKYWIGRTYATMLQNLMGHFPEYQQIVSPIEAYKKGDLDKCRASIYIGSYFENKIPVTFFEDYQTTEKNVAWLGYNIWRLKPEVLESLFGYKYNALSTLNTQIKDKAGQPTFFKNIQYKGETFFKYGKFKRDDPTQFLAPFEMTMLQETIKNPDTVVLAKAEHNGTKAVLPYILRNKNRFYVADVPFSYIHEADRYLVFADLLFDILKEKPRHDGKYAFLRIEDVHPLFPLPYIYSMTKALQQQKVPIIISLIPIFFDPQGEYTRESSQEFITMTKVPEFMQFIREMQAAKATFIWHGVTHQLGLKKNPHSGVSGDDFEFWDANNNREISQDSAPFVLDRLESGFYDLQKAGLAPKFWLTPHYQASALDYVIFGKVFQWNVGRVIYFNHTKSGLPADTEEKTLWFSKENAAKGAQRRADYFKDLKMDLDGSPWSGQFYPYEIYGDVYGQRLLPENLGNSQPVENEHVTQPRSVQEMIADAKRNRVLRDVWGSFFYHAQLMNTDANEGRGRYPGDPAELVSLITEMKKLGYNFIQIEDFANKNTVAIRPEPIYVGR